MAKPWVYVAVWHHKHGADVFLSKSEKGRLRACVRGAILPYLSELPNLKDQDKIEALCKEGKYDKALSAWIEAREDEYIDFYGTTLND